MQPKETDPGIRYAIFDKVTGQIIHTHSRFSVKENRDVAIPLEDLRAKFSNDATVIAKVSNRDPKNLDFVQVELNEAGPAEGVLMVDPVSRKLVPQPKLALSANKTEIAGDGQDSATIGISAVDSLGNVLGGASAAIKVTTNRGKLSARGGVVNLVNGRAEITLTSVNETVSKIRVSAASVDRSFAAANLDLEFV